MRLCMRCPKVDRRTTRIAIPSAGNRFEFDFAALSLRFLVDGMQRAKMAVLGERKAFVQESDGWTVEELGMSSVAAPVPEMPGDMGAPSAVPAAAA